MPANNPNAGAAKRRLGLMFAIAAILIIAQYLDDLALRRGAGEVALISTSLVSIALTGWALIKAGLPGWVSPLALAFLGIALLMVFAVSALY